MASKGLADLTDLDGLVMGCNAKTHREKQKKTTP